MTVHIDIDMDRKCSVCHEGGATQNGLCLSCIGDKFAGGGYDHLLQKPSGGGDKMKKQDEKKDEGLFGKQDDLLTTLYMEKKCVAEDLEAARKALSRAEEKVAELTGRAGNLYKAIKGVEVEAAKVAEGEAAEGVEQP